MKPFFVRLAAILIVAYSTTVKALDLNPPDTMVAAACLPLRHLRLTSAFGWRVHPITGKFQFHKGIDLAARHDMVYSILDGVVSKIGYNRLIGNYILITHPWDVQSLYGHLSVIAVLPGEQVTLGQSIAISGGTGRVTGEHLHFSIKYHGRELSPLTFLSSLLARPP